MRRMFPLLGSLLGSTLGRRRGGGGSVGIPLLIDGEPLTIDGVEVLI